MILHGSLAAAVRAHASQTPEAAALFGTARATCTYRQLAAHLDRVGALLVEHVPAGNPIIAVGASNGPDLLTALVAAMSSGICAPFDASRPSNEIEAFLADIMPSFVLTDEDTIGRHGDAFRRHGVCVVRMIATSALPAGVFDVVVEAPYSGRPTDGAFGHEADLVLLARTSGTTSSSKIVPHTMPRLMHIFTSIAEAVNLQAWDRCLNARPLHHLHAITHVAGASLVAGASIACPAETGAAALVRALRTFAPTWYSASPPVHCDVLAIARADAAPLEHTLRFVRSSSAALDARVSIDLEAALGAAVLQGYGMSEAPAIAINPPPPHVHKPGSVGRPVGCEIAILDGEVVVRGSNVAPLYVDPETGWFHTGDAGIIDGDGYLFLTGRLNELINVGGEKVTPANVERALRAHAAIVDAVAFPLPHPTLGQHVAAAVVTSDGATVTERELIEHASLLLPRQAVPNVVHQVPVIARDGNGKVRRRELAATFARAQRGAPDASIRATEHSLLHALSRIWEEVLEYAPVALDENFFAAGGDSLRAARVMSSIQTVLGITMSTDALLFAPTITLLAHAVLARANEEHPHRIVHLRTSGSRPPLFFFDGDINGGGLYARFLTAVLDAEQPIYVVRPSGALGDAIPATIEEMADADAAMIAAAVPSKVYRLAGYCNGGVVAFEVARRLEAAGATVDILALIGSSAPNALLDRLWAVTSFAARIVSRGDVLPLYRAARHTVNGVRGRSIADNFRHFATAPMLHIARRLRLAPAAQAPPAEPWSSSSGFTAYNDRLTRYFPKRSGRLVDVIWADDDVPRISGDRSMGWRHVAHVRRHSVRGDHTTMLTDHVGDLGTALRRIFDASDGNGRLGNALLRQRSQAL
jgi:acyl-CoA synthetase (AMP-forming)/AMP-acid ligase II/thioesterase domain-containing protein